MIKNDKFIVNIAGVWLFACVMLCYLSYNLSLQYYYCYYEGSSLKSSDSWYHGIWYSHEYFDHGQLPEPLTNYHVRYPHRLPRDLRHHYHLQHIAAWHRLDSNPGLPSLLTVALPSRKFVVLN